MLDWTDRHCRYFLRLISQHSVLYTEMITTGAIIYGDTDYHLQMDSFEHPVALQLGGSSPTDLAKACVLASKYDYAEINLNCGCPSDRVQNGMFGAVMMKNAQVTADCMAAMRDAVDLPVTVKHRIGVDDFDSYEFLCDFVGTVAETGCQTFLVHARKAWLKGLSPKQNREVPELNYDRVYQLKQDFPDLEIIINGGVTDLEQSKQHLERLDGVMVGREAYTNPYLLASVDQQFYGSNAPIKSREKIAEEFLNYVDNELAKGTRLQAMTRHILGLYHGMPGARQFRRHISENAYKPGATIDVLTTALAKTTGMNHDR
ncbi:MAG: tRNA-dihydrouridine(20/20a) synthase [SAR92 bacterium MED-G29]|jgi:tRNA-dihydrouridine synthase A|nr:MAG: tRNA-dihydrouridine(20/20a) synthase [SAR92 bacterium MED-G29]|tara:strand:- start:1431 stop:2381 length:951 start_codon:yes stop_codon:yes gene_type:complete